MRFFIKTYGCQMNERDSDAAAAVLVSRGFEPCEHENDADLIIFNTCSVREQAEVKAIGKLGLLKRLKRRRPDIFIGVMGCMAQRLGEELVEELPHVDFVLGTDQLHRLPEVVDAELQKRSPQVLTGTDSSVISSLSPHLDSASKVSAFIAVMRGCNRFCSYCIVPHVRGREKSRSIEDIVKEADMLVGDGVKEIYLLGQNVAAYGLGGKGPPEASCSPFADLLTALNAVDGVERIRFTSPHPAYFNDRLIDAIISLPKVCNSIHLPVQSGSDRILTLMNRPYTAAHYLKIVNKLKGALPDITFSTDVIVGFPGETDEDFQGTRDLMNEVGFDNAYIFKYSPRRGTPAADLDDQVPQQVKEERNHLLLDDLAKRNADRNLEYLGKRVQILVEGPSKRNSERWCGRTGNNKVVIFEPEPGVQPGDLLDLDIVHATSVTLFAHCHDLPR